MIGTRLLLLASIVTLAAVAAPLTAREEIHRRAEPEGGSLWVPKQDLVGAGGRLHLTALTDRGREEALEYLRQVERLKSSASDPGSTKEDTPAPECMLQAARSEPLWDYAADESFEDLVRNARVIAGGRVARIEEGLFAGVPRSLLILDEPIVLKGAPGFVLSQPKVLYPSATFVIDGVAFCASDPLFPDRPEIGDRILVYQQLPARDLEGNLLEPMHDDFFLERQEAGLVVPPWLATDSPVVDLHDFEAVLQRTRDVLQRATKGNG